MGQLIGLNQQSWNSRTEPQHPIGTKHRITKVEPNRELIKNWTALQTKRSVVPMSLSAERIQMLPYHRQWWMKHKSWFFITDTRYFMFSNHQGRQRQCNYCQDLKPAINREIVGQYLWSTSIAVQMFSFTSESIFVHLTYCTHYVTMLKTTGPE